MGRTKAPFPNVAGLALAMKLYASVSNVIDRSQVTEAHYIEILGKQLNTDGIIDGEKSRNQILKMLGKPYQSEMEKAEGLDISVLNKLAEKIISRLPSYQDNIPTLEQGSWWNYFLQNVADVPDSFQEYSKYPYYRYLSNEQKGKVDAFVNEKMMLLGNDPDVINYLVYFWGNLDMGVVCALMQINKGTGEINYNYYPEPKEGEDLGLPAVSFKRSNNTESTFLTNNDLCVIDLAEVGPTGIHKYHRMVMFLKVKDDFYSMTETKGCLLVYSSGILVPDTCEVFVRKYNTLEEARTKIKEGVPDDIYFELMKRRFPSNSIAALAAGRSLRSTPIFELSQILSRAYAFITKPADNINYKGQFVIGLAFFEKKGYVTFRVGHHRRDIKNYIENVYSNGADIVRLNPLIEDGEDEDTKLHFYIKALYEPDASSEIKIKYLVGNALGLRSNQIYSSDVVFMPLTYSKSEVNSMQDLLRQDVSDYLVYRTPENLHSSSNPILKSLITKYEDVTKKD